MVSSWPKYSIAPHCCQLSTPALNMTTGIPAATASRLRSGVSTTRLTIRQGTTGRRGATPISLSGGYSPGSGCASPQTTLQVRVPYEGLYKWRVAGVSGEGVEGLPSTDGLFVVVDR